MCFLTVKPWQEHFLYIQSMHVKYFRYSTNYEPLNVNEFPYTLSLKNVCMLGTELIVSFPISPLIMEVTWWKIVK